MSDTRLGEAEGVGGGCGEGRRRSHIRIGGMAAFAVVHWRAWMRNNWARGKGELHVEIRIEVRARRVRITVKRKIAGVAYVEELEMSSRFIWLDVDTW